MPSTRWFIKNCTNKNVKDFNDFIEWCGFKANRKLSKEKAVEIIYKMQSKLNRPLMYDDFRNPSKDEIGIGTIKKHWGTMNQMKQELGLEVIQESMIDKQKSLNELKNDIIKLCNEIYIKEQRKTITLKDINKSNYCLSHGTYSSIFKENGFTLRKFIENLGFELQNSGTGFNNTFEDGEKTVSYHELEFSKYLRSLNLNYNVDYFRNIRYNTFIKDCKSKQDCDYVINYKGKNIYIEIAGILRDYKNNYLNDIPISSSKSKEKYRIKLKEKEKMLNDNNLDYLILFPSDLTEENLNNIFDNLS